MANEKKKKLEERAKRTKICGEICGEIDYRVFGMQDNTIMFTDHGVSFSPADLIRFMDWCNAHPDSASDLAVWIRKLTGERAR